MLTLLNLIFVWNIYIFLHPNWHTVIMVIHDAMLFLIKVCFHIVSWWESFDVSWSGVSLCRESLDYFRLLAWQCRPICEAYTATVQRRPTVWLWLFYTVKRFAILLFDDTRNLFLYLNFLQTATSWNVVCTHSIRLISATYIGLGLLVKCIHVVVLIQIEMYL